MNIKLKSDTLAVFDEVLDAQHFHQFVQYFCNVPYTYRHSSGWHKVWRASDGEILSGPEQKNTEPINNPFGWIVQNLQHLAKDHIGHIIGEQGVDYDHISVTPYIYPVNSKISWHDDTGYVAAAIFYCHLKWSPNWGGELMIAHTPKDAPLVGMHNDPINREYIDNLLSLSGHGVYVAPLPNRLVITKGSVWHQINRVDLSAGDNSRCSIVCFFRKNPKPVEEPTETS